LARRRGYRAAIDHHSLAPLGLANRLAPEVQGEQRLRDREPEAFAVLRLMVLATK